MKFHNARIKETIALFILACSFALVQENFTAKVLAAVPGNTIAAVEGKTGSFVFAENVQRGELLATAYGDIDGDGEEEKILLLGNKFGPGSQYYTNLYLLTKETKTDHIESAIRPTIAGGYDCSLRLADVTGNGVDDVLIVAPTGGSGGIIDYRIVDFTDNKPREIFTAEDNQGVPISGDYLPDYKVQITFGEKAKKVIMDVPSDIGLYGYLGVYGEDGSLLQNYHHPYGQYLSGLLMLDTDGDGVSEVVTTQRIVGLNNTDTLGYVRAVWRYTAVAWRLDSYTFQSKLETFGHSIERENYIGLGGYKVCPEKMIIGRTQISYPRLSNVGKGPQQWKANEQIENFVRNQFNDVRNKGYLEMNYEVKYGGKYLLSILMNGKKEGKAGSDDIIKAFNLDVRSGEQIPLEKLFGNDRKMWAKVAKITAAQGNKVTAGTMSGYYIDGESIVFLQKNEEKQRMEELTVPLKELAKYCKNKELEKLTD